MPYKGKKFQSKFNWWFDREILWGQLGRQPTDDEVDQVVAKAHSTLYDKDKAEGWIRKIQEWVPHFESKVCRKFVTNAKTPEFPMKFNECLRRVIGGRSVGDRLHFFRKYWASQLKQFENMDYAELECIKTDEGRLNKANAMIEKFTRDGVDKYWFNSISAGFSKWRQENRIQQCRNAANMRWQKNLKKSLGGDKQPEK
jgi:hypothetical protein